MKFKSDEISLTGILTSNRLGSQQGQFCHVATYARMVSKKTGNSSSTSGEVRGKTWSVTDISREADRHVNHIPHVRNPKPPTLVCGRPVNALESICEELLKDATQSNGKSLRKDTHVLLAAVYSLPIRPAHYSENKGKCDQFIWDALKWHTATYGAVESAICHLDEGFIHWHVYSVSQDARGMISGWREKRAEIAKSLSIGMSKNEANREGNKAFKTAMIALQDSFYEDVGSINELARYGSRRQRYAPGTGESTVKRLEREEFSIRERAAREREQAERKKLARDIEEQEALNFRANQIFEENQAAKNEILLHAKRLQEIDELTKAKRKKVDDMVERLISRSEYIRENELRVKGEELVAAKLKIGELEKIVIEQKSLIDLLKGVIANMKNKIKSLFGNF